MIIWINGPYGVGKSTLADELHRRNPDSFIFDAETVGNTVRDNLPKQRFHGYIFENYPMWFTMCAMLLNDIACKFSGDIYVPMTLVWPDSFSKIERPLATHGHTIKHILLTSTYDTVHDRILARGEDENCWCMQNIRLCLEQQASFDNVIRIESRSATVEELATSVRAAICLNS